MPTDRQGVRGVRARSRGGSDAVARGRVAPLRCGSARLAFTLLEVMVTLTVIAVIAAFVAPMLTDDSRVRLMAAASVLSSDIELAQVMTISYPDQAVVVRFDAPNQRYWLAYAYDPGTPMPRPDTFEPYEVVFGQGRASGAQGVDVKYIDLAGDMLSFNAQGGLTDFTQSPRIELSRGDLAITLTIAPTTGTITETDGTIEDAMAAQ